MSFLDWILLLVWLGVTLSGFWEGAVRLVFGGGGLIAGLWLAIAVGGDAAAALEPVLAVAWLAAVLGRVLPLLGCVLVALAAGWGIERTLKALHLKWLNRLGGAMLAGVVAAALLGLFLVTAMRLSPAWNEWCGESVLAPRLVRLWGWTVESQEAAAEAVSLVEGSITR
jgi:uncharacterized membrane protein required for colicin V production